MGNLIELDSYQASLISGGKNEDTAKVVEFVAQCIGTVAKLIYRAYKLKKLFLSPGTV